MNSRNSARYLGLTVKTLAKKRSNGTGPKFVKRYANLGDTIVEAATAYRRDVEAGTYPDEAHSY